MENARLLEERLKKIFREVSSITGREIQNDLLADFKKEVSEIVQQNTRRELTRTLVLFRNVLRDL